MIMIIFFRNLKRERERERRKKTSERKKIPTI